MLHDNAREHGDLHSGRYAQQWENSIVSRICSSALPVLCMQTLIVMTSVLVKARQALLAFSHNCSVILGK